MQLACKNAFEMHDCMVEFSYHFHAKMHLKCMIAWYNSVTIISVTRANPGLSRKGVLMVADYIHRSLETVLKKAIKEFPVVVLTGPRQSGKTTLVRHLLTNKYEYVSLEPPDIQDAASSNPRGFLATHTPAVILDEVQHAPELLPYVKEHIDEHRGTAGQFILTGSQNLLLIDRVAETLAGRAAILRLLPLSWREIAGQPKAPLIWETKKMQSRGEGYAYDDLFSKFLRGGYPELAANPGRDHWLWHSSYMQTYLERDVRSLRQIGDLTQFQNLLQALAARSAQLINVTDMARDLGIAVNTVKAWLSVLEATFQIIILRPYFANIGKRLVKSPKIYFTDVGVLCHLLRLRDTGQIAAGPLGGAIIETAVLSEIVKTILHRGEEPRVYFWRTALGSEVDIIVDTGMELVPIEVKHSATPRPAMADGIKAFQADLGSRAGGGFVIHPGDVSIPLAPEVTAIPFSSL
jgi:predicted AAA+ superfamily ATPase